MLGLALVVGSVGLLLGGTAYGFRAYLNTVHTTERKLNELQQVNVILVTLTGLQRPTTPDVNTEYSELSFQANQAQAFAGVYRTELHRTVEAGLDPDSGFQEDKLLDQFEAALQKFTLALHAARVKSGEFANRALRDDPEVKASYDESQRIGQQLKQTVVDDIDTGIRTSNATIRQSRLSEAARKASRCSGAFSARCHAGSSHSQPRPRGSKERTALRSAGPNSRSMAIASPVAFICTPSDRSANGNLSNGQRGSLTTT